MLKGSLCGMMNGYNCRKQYVGGMTVRNMISRALNSSSQSWTQAELGTASGGENKVWGGRIPF